MPRTYDLMLQVPKEFCKWCQAYLGLVNGQYCIIAKTGCNWCKGTGDHNVGTINRCLNQHEVSIGTVYK